MLHASRILSANSLQNLAMGFINFVKSHGYGINVSDSGSSIYVSVMGPEKRRVKVRFSNHKVPSYSNALYQHSPFDYSVDPGSGSLEGAKNFVLESFGV